MNTASRLFHDLGYFVVPSLFSNNEITEFRASHYASRWHRGDLLSNPMLCQTITDGRLGRIARNILGKDVVYFGESTIHGKTPAVRPHRDNADRHDSLAPDWREGYGIVKFAVYLQDYSSTAGGLTVQPGTHRSPEQKASGVYLNTAPGDVVVWDLRLVHGGGGKQRTLRHCPEPRLSMFAVFASAGPHLDRYLTYLQTRSYQIDLWWNSHYTQDTIGTCRANGFEVIDMPSRIRTHSNPEGLGTQQHWAPIPY